MEIAINANLPTCPFKELPLKQLKGWRIFYQAAYQIEGRVYTPPLVVIPDEFTRCITEAENKL